MMDLRVKQRVVLEALEDVKGRDIVIYNTARMPSMFERVVIASGESTRQVKALADRVQERIREQGSRVYGVEGEASGEWVLVDLGDVVVHIMHPAIRAFYNLEEVWGGQTVRLKPGANPATKKKGKKTKVKVKVKAKAKARSAPKNRAKAKRPRDRR